MQLDKQPVGVRGETSEGHSKALSEPRDKWPSEQNLRVLGDTAFSIPRSPPVREAFSPVLRHSGRRGVQEPTAARHGDIGTPRHPSCRLQSSRQVSQGPNALNKSMQGLWQRRKVNLNATPTAPSANVAPTPLPAPTSAPPTEDPPRPDSVPPASGNAEELPQTTASSGMRKL